MDLGFRVQGSGSGFYGFGAWGPTSTGKPCLESRVEGFGFGVQGFRV